MRAVIINHNSAVYNAQRQYYQNTSKVAKNLEKLGSGLKVNGAGDDASGLAISEKMRAQIYSLERASKNTLDGISVVQTGEAGLQEMHEMLHRLREIAIQSASDTNIDSIDRVTLQAEVNALLEGIDYLAKRTEFNREKLFDGSFTERVVHIGANSNENIIISINAMDLKGLKLDEGLKIAIEDIEYGPDGQPITTGGILTQEDSNLAIKRIDESLNILSSQRSALGALENSLEHVMRDLGVAIQNVTDSEARIRNMDMAKGLMDYTKNSILTESTQAMIAHAHQTPDGVRRLLA